MTIKLLIGRVDEIYHYIKLTAHEMGAIHFTFAMCKQ